MCTVNIDIDEALLRDVMPELNSTAAIRSWAQQLIDLRIQGMLRREFALQRDMTPEELYDVIAEEIDSIYANG